MFEQKTKFLAGALLVFFHSAFSFASSETQCVRQALVYGYSSEVAVALCIGASSDSPVSCYREAMNIQRLTEAQAVELCRPKPCLCR